MSFFKEATSLRYSKHTHQLAEQRHPVSPVQTAIWPPANMALSTLVLAIRPRAYYAENSSWWFLSILYTAVLQIILYKKPWNSSYDGLISLDKIWVTILSWEEAGAMRRPSSCPLPCPSLSLHLSCEASSWRGGRKEWGVNTEKLRTQ